MLLLAVPGFPASRLEQGLRCIPQGHLQCHCKITTLPLDSPKRSSVGHAVAMRLKHIAVGPDQSCGPETGPLLQFLPNPRQVMKLDSKAPPPPATASSEMTLFLPSWGIYLEGLTVLSWPWALVKMSSLST